MEYQVVYAVICNAKKTDFADWALTSMHALRHLKHKYRIFLCVDCKTIEALRSINHQILDIPNVILSIASFNGTERERSRWLKANLRLMVEGDFVYLDSDTLPINDLSELYEHKFEFAAVNIIDSSPETEGWLEKSICDLEWVLSPTEYFNAGVFFIRDTKTTRAFSQLWCEKWLKWRTYDKSGVNADQPSFNSALYESGVSTLSISNRFNLFMKHPNVRTDDPVIFHFPQSFRPMKRSSLLSILAKELKETDEFNLSLFKNAQITGDPWVSSFLVVWVEYLLSGFNNKFMQTFRKIVDQRNRKNYVR
ncbi:glycosyltransferase [Sneathiella limimaris]|uniref:glycosyltransferase n=1 Tax=Sneathiella limimaris TaxID=1964213 RepID=UPI00146DA264|nr:glycosyltransferase [Sneathiella limimaris]